MKTEQIIIENNARLSESILWQFQRDYFHREGINAWDSHVPNFITSNCFIANSYANLAVSFLRDQLQKDPAVAQHPIYIFELGTGTGQFSFYVLKRILEICRDLNIDEKSFYYVMTDFTESNLKFWQSQPCLKEFIEKGILDFAIYNMEENDEIHLTVKNRILRKENIVNPVIVFANYIFDTISHDCFSIKDNKIHEVQIHISAEKDNLLNERVVDMERLTLNFSELEIQTPYYDDPHLDRILENYQDKINNSNILLPISGIRSIARLRELSNDKLLIISSDKGQTLMSELDDLTLPDVSFHGSFSLMVNFHAIAEYFKAIGGDYFFQTWRTGIKTCLFMTAGTLDELPQTRFAAKQYIEDFSPADYFMLHRYISDTYNEAELNVLAAHLVLTCYDPFMYHRLNERICSLLPEANTSTIEFLKSILDKILTNFYYMPIAEDTLFDIAYFYHILNEYDKALHYYEQSLMIFGKKIGALYNSSMCQYHLGKTKEALELIEDAMKLNPNEEELEKIEFWRKNIDIPRID